MVALHGSATRPAGSDNHWPPVGTVVQWYAVQPVVDLATQALKAGWPILGTIGEKLTHLTKHGDHTPWSDKKRGYVYAIDLAPPAPFEAHLVALCKSDFDTTWIDFWNMNGSQYDHAGNKVADSGDHHLHLSVALGYEAKHVTLITDYLTKVTAAAPTKTSTPVPQQEDDMAGRGEDIYTLLHDGKRAGPAQTAGGGVAIAWIVRELDTVNDTLAQIKDALTKLSMDVAALAGPPKR